MEEEDSKEEEHSEEALSEDDLKLIADMDKEEEEVSAEVVESKEEFEGVDNVEDIPKKEELKYGL